jgi:hypothetical protein
MLTDDDLTAKLTEAFGEQAGRPVRADLDAAGIFRRGRRRRHHRIAARVVSVTAAAGLVAGVLIAQSGPAAPTRVAQAPTHSAAPTSRLPGNILLDAAVAPVLPAAAAEAGLPQYYIVGSQTGATLNTLQVRSSATGKVISGVARPAACVPATFQLTASGNDRDFFVSCLTTSHENAFYRLRITSGGSIDGFTALPIPSFPNQFVTGLAITPDGTKLAIGLQKNAGAVIEVVTLATGAVRTWAGPKMDRPTQLSWADNGRELGFWSLGLRVLDASTAGTNLASARLVLSIFHASDLVQDAVLGPDGATIIASVSYQLPRGVHLSRNSVVGGIVQISARTGKPERTLIAGHPITNGSGTGLAIAPCVLGPVDLTGHHVLASCNQFGRADRGRFTALPGIDPLAAFTAAW